MPEGHPFPSANEYATTEGSRRRFQIHTRKSGGLDSTPEGQSGGLDSAPEGQSGGLDSAPEGAPEG